MERVNLSRKGGHIRIVLVPSWVKVALDHWLRAARIAEGALFRRVSRTGNVWGPRISEKLVWWIVRQRAQTPGIDRLAPHDLRRTCARLCHAVGGELEQIQFLLGHRSVETTERYLGSRQRLAFAVNDRIGLEPGALQSIADLPKTRLCGSVVISPILHSWRRSCPTKKQLDSVWSRCWLLGWFAG